MGCPRNRVTSTPNQDRFVDEIVCAHEATNAVPADNLHRGLRRVSWLPSLWEPELAVQGVLEVPETANHGVPAPSQKASHEDDPRGIGTARRNEN